MPRLNWKHCINSFKMKKNQFGCLSRKKLFSVVLVKIIPGTIQTVLSFCVKVKSLVVPYTLGS